MIVMKRITIKAMAFRLVAVLAVAVAMASCAGKKALSETTTGNIPAAAASTASKKTETAGTEFLKRVAGNQLQAKNIVASADFRLVGAGKDMGCDGKLSMRRDEVIRLQLLLPIIRTEIARIDFTPDYVLLVDRYHKEYIKASYKEVSFLAENGISFYSLQALFWNQLFVPGEKSLTPQSLSRLACQLDGPSATGASVEYRKGNMSYVWDADKTTALIKSADIAYTSRQAGRSSLKWTYDNFRSVGGKQFPLTQQFVVNANVNGKTRTAQLSIKMGSAKTSSDWDTTTELSSKYKKIEAADILGKLLSIQ